MLVRTTRDPTLEPSVLVVVAVGLEVDHQLLAMIDTASDQSSSATISVLDFVFIDCHQEVSAALVVLVLRLKIKI